MLGARWLFCGAMLAGAVCHAATLDELKAHLAGAKAKYDSGTAVKVLEETKAFAAANPGDPANWALADAAVTVAQFKRYDYGLEEDSMEGKEKRALGKEIDAASQAGIAALGKLPETSEKFRMLADLYACMIRSDFTGKKYGDKMTDLADKAVALDPKNPMALVCASKRLVFAKPIQGGDLPKGTDYLNRALAIDPKCIEAYVIRGFAFEHKNDLDGAMNDWKKALELNPNCKPAEESFERVKRLKDIRAGKK